MEDDLRKQAGLVEIGGYILLNGFVCEVKEIFQTIGGKNGVKTLMFICKDIFSNKKLDTVVTSLCLVDIPVVRKYELQVIDIDQNGLACLMQEDHTIKEDSIESMMQPMEQDLASNLKKDFDAGKEIMALIISANCKERIISYREVNFGRD